MEPQPLSVRPYAPTNPTRPFPYTQADMTPTDPGNDASFYAPPRFVTHIDDNAIVNLKRYYDDNLPEMGTILDFCSSWISHYPPRIHDAVAKGEIVVLGTGMNEAELARNPVFAPGKDADVAARDRRWWLQDLNVDPDVPFPKLGGQEVKLDASTCVVSIDYLTKPVEVLSSIRHQTNQGGKVHLAISNRCFPTKVVGRWLEVNEKQRLEMVGNYLHYAGWRDIEIVDVVIGGFLNDPLWVVRATKT
ncbi:hypothetical protein LTR70_008777 [Exophiala xenobiotica]|uniref:Uncharacterized protein n=1 Tax=Lithohypha guttulata TaxID=1690604 RepID=A0ABR0JZY9_9EURO|nr:hypothetical protein LTR24_008449 [Lithohypha guttulata]KAK5311486.1 hypothetical protein LTR70_008777 [Exophiala xenobiotica]